MAAHNGGTMSRIRSITRKTSHPTPAPADLLGDVLDLLCDSYGACGGDDKCKGSNSVEVPILGCVRLPSD